MTLTKDDKQQEPWNPDRIQPPVGFNDNQWSTYQGITFASPKSWHFKGTPQKSQQGVRWLSCLGQGWKNGGFFLDEGEPVPGHLWPYSRRLGLFGQPAANNDHLTSHSSWASVAYQNPLWRVKFTSVIYLDFLKDACILIAMFHLLNETGWRWKRS